MQLVFERISHLLLLWLILVFFALLAAYNLFWKYKYVWHDFVPKIHHGQAM